MPPVEADDVADGKDVPQPVTSSQALQAACDQLRRGDFIVLDTEFHRESTYWPELCLIQAATSDFDVIIDPLAANIDLSPFLALLADPVRPKILHAARQDMEIFTRLIGVPPYPVFDTQIAAMACGLGDTISYESLVRQILGKKVDKRLQLTDWSRRPLLPAQLRYARLDVTLLGQIYPILAKRLNDMGRNDWIADEIALLHDKATYESDPNSAWKRLKLRRSSLPYLAILAAVARWREHLARKRNKPRRWILGDEAIQDIAIHAPGSYDELKKLRSVPKSFSASAERAAELIKIVRTARTEPGPSLPVKTESKPPPSGLIDLLRCLLRAVAADLDVVPRLIADSADIECIARHDSPDTRATKGWRWEVFGALATDLRAGMLCLGIGPKGVEIIRRDPRQPHQPRQAGEDPSNAEHPDSLSRRED